MSKKETDKILDLIRKNDIVFRIFRHEPVYTSIQASEVRGTESGKFLMALVSADKRIDENKLENVSNKENVKLASPDEVFGLTGCKVGSVPPFGNLWNLETFMDKSVLKNKLVNFNAGQLTVSIQISPKDLLKINNSILCDIS